MSRGVGFDLVIDAGVRERFLEARLHVIRKGLILDGAPDVDPRAHFRSEPVRAVGSVVRETAAVIGSGSHDVVRVSAGGDERHSPAHAIARGADPAGLDVALSVEVIEERPRVGHDVGRGRDREEFLHQDLALLGIREDGFRIHRLVRAGAVEKVRQQHEIAMSRQPLGKLQHGRTDREAVHEDEHRRPGAGACGAIEVARTEAVSSLDIDPAHAAYLPHPALAGHGGNAEVGRAVIVR